MTTQYTWSIVQMDRNTVDGFVVTVHYNVSANDEVNSTSIYGTVSYTPTTETIVPYEELTKETVIGWVQESLGKDSVEASLQLQLDALATPVQKSGLPWSS